MRWLTILAALFVATAARAAEPRLVLVTLDGLSWTEVFRGADPARAADRAFVTEASPLKRAFVDPPDRAAALMPFLHGTIASQGVLIGDRDHGSCMAIANDNGFSYAGYNELLTGRPDPAIKSNAHGPNKNVTFLAWLIRQPRFKGQVEAVTSWDTFRDILAGGGGAPLNAGWAGTDPARPELTKLQADAPRIWSWARLDGFTHAWALDALKRRKPRVLYVAYDETDDFAHEGRYDQATWAAHRADGFLAELWKTLQADPAYRGRTTMIVTTDHGRGTEDRDGWKSHGRSIKGSEATWLAAIGPAVKRGAPLSGCATSSQVAASALTALGLDWKAFDGAAAPPLPVF